MFLHELLQDDPNDTDMLDKAPSLGRPKRPANLIDQRQMNRRLKNIYETIVNECENEKIEMDTLLSFIGRKFYLTQGENFDRSKGLMYSKIFNKADPFQQNRLTAEQTAYLQESLEIGKEKLQQMKTFLGRIHFL